MELIKRKVSILHDTFVTCKQANNAIIQVLDKRFKTSPFAWSNPLSGYMLVVIPEGPQKTAEKFQLKLVKDPTTLIGLNKNYRDEYIMKLLKKFPLVG